MNRRDLQILSGIRLAEAKSLLAAGFPDGAYYLAGYAVKCALKACIAKETRRCDFPDKKKVDASFTHKLTDLIKVANLERACSEEARADTAFRNNWDLVQQWSEHSRYRRHDSDMAAALLKAVSAKRHGVVPWIKRYW